MAPWFSYRHRQMGTGAVTESADGFWGKVTASLDWCEGNYEISYYIAEFWNTVSNVSFLLPSLFAAWYVWRVGYAPRFVLAHLSVALIGLGSTLFHMTLKYTMQLADELPMLYGTAALLYCVIELPKARSEAPNTVFAIALFSLTTVVSIAYVVRRDPIIFFSCYTIYTTALVILGTVAMYRYGNAESRFLGYSALGSYALGFTLWAYENSHCPTVEEWRLGLGPVLGVFTQLHAFWHLLAAMGGYLLVITSLHVNILVGAGRPRIVYHSRMLPVVTNDGGQMSPGSLSPSPTSNAYDCGQKGQMTINV
ncbi:alkaline ceramidase 3-like [Sycon ciliatum]|uniref:alkaline ceramidase 3-like n=1 Tax=Sycon ciliatum TaxID=27933 RepID=UPI0020A9DCFE|eukprot:scpid82108/ scgid0933/ Alkaline ceramidase 3; Alkaline dihydroceramidase SB89; Alkaline phytoceramidase